MIQEPDIGETQKQQHIQYCYHLEYEAVKRGVLHQFCTKGGKIPAPKANSVQKQRSVPPI